MIIVTIYRNGRQVEVYNDTHFQINYEAKTIFCGGYTQPCKSVSLEYTSWGVKIQVEI